MKLQTTAILVLVAVVVCLPCQASAQRLHIFLTAGSNSVNGRDYAGISTGAGHDLFSSWISAGVEGDVFFSGGYAAGRAGPVGQLNFLRDRHLRPFVIAGHKWGEGDGPLVGGGVEYRPGSKFGFRASVEDIFRTVILLPPCGVVGYPPCSAVPSQSQTAHGVSIQVGIAFR